MKKIDETIVTMTTENNHLGGMTMKNNLNTANDVLPEHAAEPEDYRVDGILYCGKCRTPKEILVPEEQARQLGLRSNPFSVRCACSRAKLEEKDARAQELAHRKKVEQLKKDCFGTADAMREWTFENDDGSNPKMEYIHNFVDRWEEVCEKGLGLLIWGGIGTGKSFAAACIANALIEQGVSVIMMNSPEIMDALYEEKSGTMNKLSSCGLLIIDDLGSERDSQFSREQVFKVIDRRLLSGKPLVVTTNLSLEEFKKPQSDDEARIISRLMDTCPQPVQFVGEDRRKIIAEDKRAEMTALLTGESA